MTRGTARTPLTVICARPTELSLVKEIEGGAALEPLDLGCAVGVPERQRVRRAVGVPDDARDGLAGREILETGEAQTVVLADLVVVRRVGERERQQPLLLEVTLVDSREGSGNDGGAAQESRRQGGVFPA